MKFYPWHQATYQQLTDAFLNERGHHALLFKTEDGLGTQRLIRHFAHWLFCQHRQQRIPCGQCKSCLLWQSGNHPDFHLLEPIEEKDIGVDQVRALTTTLQQFAQQGGNAVVYLAGAERLTEAAANALLKTLEEPHSNVYFLLEAPMQTALLATIQSRCQTWLIHAPESEQAYHWLQPHFPQQPSSALQTALRLCHNRPLICKHFLETDRLSVRQAFMRTFWQFYKSGDVWLLLSAFEHEPAAILQQLEWLESFFSDALKAKMGIATGWLNPDLEKGIVPFAQELSSRSLLSGIQIIQQTQHDLRTVNAVNPPLMLADCLTKLVLDVFAPSATL